MQPVGGGERSRIHGGTQRGRAGADGGQEREIKTGTHEAKHVSPKTAKESRIPSRTGGFSGRRFLDRRYIILRCRRLQHKLEAEQDGMRARISSGDGCQNTVKRHPVSPRAESLRSRACDFTRDIVRTLIKHRRWRRHRSENARGKKKENVDTDVSPGARRLRNDGPFKRSDHRSTSWNLNGRREGHFTHARRSGGRGDAPGDLKGQRRRAKVLRSCHARISPSNHMRANG